MTKMTTAQTTKTTLRIRYWLVAIFIFAVYIWSFLGIPFEGLTENAGKDFITILKGLFTPDWGYVYMPEGEDLVRGLLDTLAISILGTVISAFLCVPFAFWAANNMSRFRWVPGSGKFMLSFIRTFPEIIMAIIFIKAVGPGARSALDRDAGKAVFGSDRESRSRTDRSTHRLWSESHTGALVCCSAAGTAAFFLVRAVPLRN